MWFTDWRRRRRHRHLCRKFLARPLPRTPEELSGYVQALLQLHAQLSGIHFDRYSPRRAEQLQFSTRARTVPELLPSLTDFTEQCSRGDYPPKPRRFPRREAITVSLEYFLQDDAHHNLPPEGVYHDLIKTLSALAPYLDNIVIARMGFTTVSTALCATHALLQLLN